MQIHLKGNTGFNSAKREKEILSLFDNRFHEFAKNKYLGDQDVLECLRIKAEQENDHEMVEKLQIRIDILVKGLVDEN